MKSTRSLIAIFFLLASTAQADSISISESAPADNVYLSFDAVATSSGAISNQWRNWKSFAPDNFDQSTGATFQVGPNDVTAHAISILFSRTDEVAALPMRFMLYHASGRDDAGGTFAGTFGEPTVDTIVAEFTTTVDLPSLGNTDLRYMTFDFDDVPLQAGQWYGFYGIIDGFDSDYGDNSQAWKNAFVPGVDSNPDSAALRHADTNRAFVVAEGTGAGYDGDIAFWLQATAVPEPASIVIFAIGVSGVVGARRMRRRQA